MPEHPTPTLTGQAQADRELVAKAAIFGTRGEAGYIPQALSLMVGSPTAAELEEAEILLTLASLAVRHWRRDVPAGPEVGQ